jgi:hypothetical protein
MDGKVLMKHVIVLGTLGPITPRQVRMIEAVFDDYLYSEIETKFNVDSAIAAVHEMYDAPKWNPDKENQ